MRVAQIDLAQRTIRLEPGTTKNTDGREVVMTEEFASSFRLHAERQAGERCRITCSDSIQATDGAEPFIGVIVIRGGHVATECLIVADDRPRNRASRRCRPQIERVLDDHFTARNDRDILTAVDELKMQVPRSVHRTRAVGFGSQRSLI